MLTLLDLEIDGTTYRYSDQSAADYPNHAPRLNLYSEIDITAADIQSGRQKETVCRVWLSNRVIARYSTDHPTILEILNADHAVVGARARVRKIDSQTGTTQHDFTGIVQQVGDFAEAYAQIIIEVHVRVSRTVRIPTTRLLDIFPLAPVPEDAALAWVFGHAKKLRAHLVANDDVIRFTVATSTPGFHHVIWTMTGLPAVTAALGDTLQYEFAIGELRTNAVRPVGYRFRMYVDIGTATQWLSDVPGIRDQLGHGVRTNFTDEPFGVFRQRVFHLPDSWAGQSITRTRLVGIPGQQDPNTFGTPQGIVGFLARARIFDVAGASKQEIIQTDRTYTGMGSGLATEYTEVTAITADQFGAWQRVLVEEANAYINGVLIPKDIGGSGDGFLVSGEDGYFGDPEIGMIWFNDETASFDPFTIAVHVDATSNAFSLNPARALCFVLQQIGYGVDLNAVNTAAAAYDTLGITVGGAVENQTAAPQVLSDLLLHGAALEHGPNGVQILVDTQAAHPEADIELGAGDTSGWNNFTVGSIATASLIDDFFLQAGYDPGFADDVTWTASVRQQIRTPVEQAYQRDLPYLGDTDSFGREARYRLNRLQQASMTIVGTVPTTAYGADTLRFGQRIRLTIPLRGLDRMEMEIVGWHQTQDTIELTLIPWDAAVFTGTRVPVQGSIFLNEAVPQGGTAPNPPTNLVFYQTRDASSYIPFGGFSLVYDVRFYLRATAPADNVTHLIFWVTQVNDPARSFPERFVAVTPGQTVDSFHRQTFPGGFGGWDTAPVFGRVQAYNAANSPGRQRSVTVSTPATST